MCVKEHLFDQIKSRSQLIVETFQLNLRHRFDDLAPRPAQIAVCRHRTGQTACDAVHLVAELLVSILIRIHLPENRTGQDGCCHELLFLQHTCIKQEPYIADSVRAGLMQDERHIAVHFLDQNRFRLSLDIRQRQHRNPGEHLGGILRILISPQLTAVLENLIDLKLVQLSLFVLKLYAFGLLKPLRPAGFSPEGDKRTVLILEQVGAHQIFKVLSTDSLFEPVENTHCISMQEGLIIVIEPAVQQRESPDQSARCAPRISFYIGETHDIDRRLKSLLINAVCHLLLKRFLYNLHKAITSILRRSSGCHGKHRLVYATVITARDILSDARFDERSLDRRSR